MEEDLGWNVAYEERFRWEGEAMILEKKSCPHCGQILDRWEPHSESGWDHALLVCNNDQCAYFVRGREKICSEFKVNFAYRYCYDPCKDQTIPLVTWCGGRLSRLKGRCA